MPSFENFQGSSHYKITVDQWPGVFFTELSGGEENNDTSLQHTGGFGPPQVISAPSTTGQITITKPRDHAVDLPVEAWSKAWHAGVHVPLNVTVVPTTPAGIPSGPARTYTECARVSLTVQQPSKGSSDAATIVLALQPRDVV